MRERGELCEAEKTYRLTGLRMWTKWRTFDNPIMQDSTWKLLIELNIITVHKCDFLCQYGAFGPSCDFGKAGWTTVFFQSQDHRIVHCTKFLILCFSFFFIFSIALTFILMTPWFSLFYFISSSDCVYFSENSRREAPHTVTSAIYTL